MLFCLWSISKYIAWDHLRNPLTLHLEVVTGFPCVATVTVLERLCAWETDATCHFIVPCHFTSQPNQMVSNLEIRNRDERSASPRGSQGPCTDILSIHSVLAKGPRPSRLHIPLCSFKQKIEFWFSHRIPPLQQESPGIFSSGISAYENWGNAWLNWMRLMSKAKCVNTDGFILECWGLCAWRPTNFLVHSGAQRKVWYLYNPPLGESSANSWAKNFAGLPPPVLWWDI